ncbi:cdp-diacylglycerol--glycerol-3-phosphate 3-phosphatidyltransferase, putative [Pediculus humanus corporis]|uniref:cardiolipin synthase (CMP-forming) n=1 Tax=Pediculus humanus subsp. corporis TaxID=121224 RepID=E0VYG7_PEDHC|nr:cdp-diacylglycerol--glycerol-3-phosphate 3-phosphatidyltransferase, putative [Pediculus humanus corporis]EEB18423.1 cdp-diacylglycerol--glycerol-3-phosphate 3-phosphatidyltransferase, putative [Pediculus humanus corporis]
MQHILKIMCKMKNGWMTRNMLEKRNKKIIFEKMFNDWKISCTCTVTHQRYEKMKGLNREKSSITFIRYLTSDKMKGDDKNGGRGIGNDDKILMEKIIRMTGNDEERQRDGNAAAKISFKNAKRKMKEKGKIIIQDIKDTKNKMKEKFEGVIERENVYTIPNLICVTRIGLSPLLGYLIISENFEYALAFMVIAGISDWIDGWVARNYKSQSSKIGSFLDPMADKVLIGTLFLSLTYVSLIPVALTALVIFRDVILITSGFVIRYQSLPPPRTLSRYFDVTHATAQLAPTFISKVNTGVQLVLVGTTLAAPIFGYVDHVFLQIMCYVTAGSTIMAAGSYLTSKETYKFLKSQKKL